MQCNKSGCKQTFHVTCAQSAGLLCEEAGNYQDNVKYCGYCDYHYQRIVRNKSNVSSDHSNSANLITIPSSSNSQNKKIIKTIPAYRPIPSGNLSSSPDASPEKKPAGGENPVHHSSPAASPDRRSGSSKKGRRPNSAASDLSDGQSKPHNPDHQKVPNNHQDQDQLSSSLMNQGQQNRSPTSANTSSTSASSSSKQSSTSSLTDATSSSSPEPAPAPNPIVKAHPALQSASSEDKPAPVIVKLAKADGVYYNKKDEKKYHKKPDSNLVDVTTPNFNSFNEDVKNVHCEFSDFLSLVNLGMVMVQNKVKKYR